MSKKRKTLKETEMYRPLAEYLAGEGYTVRGEVRHCDVVATKGAELIAIEMKNQFSTKLLVQATQRQRAADSVYIAVPRPPATRDRAHWRHIQHLLRQLEIGLIFVSSNGYMPKVEIVFHPLPFVRQRSQKKRRAILAEAEKRSGDFNEGGSTRRKIVTAYREEAICIALALAERGPTSPKDLRALGTGARTLSILGSDFYGWFQRVERGVYDLNLKGRAALVEYGAVAERVKGRFGAPCAPA